MRGDDGTYRLLDTTATLVREAPSEVRFRAQLMPGLHVAFLQLTDATAGVVMQEIPLSVRVPGVPRLLAPWVEQYEARIPPRRLEHLYVRVGAETQAARYVMRRREVSINDVAIAETDRKFFWLAPGPRPTSHSGIPNLE